MPISPQLNSLSLLPGLSHPYRSMWWAVLCSARGENPTMKLVVLRSSLDISSVKSLELNSSPDRGAEISLRKIRFD